MIDLHCHYLPGVDDGPRTLAESLVLLRAAEENGIRQAVLTPHIYPGVFENRRTHLQPVFEGLQEAASAAGIGVQLYLGAEMRLDAESLSLLAAGEVPLIGQWESARVLLLEFPDGQIPVGALRVCADLVARGIRPLIAHPERNREVMRDPARIAPFVAAGCLLQITAASVIGRFGARALDVCRILLEAGQVSVIASDAHNMAHRPPLLREAQVAIASRYGQALADRLVESTPAAIIAAR